MKLSRNFVNCYVDILTDTKTLADDMTSIGNEYDDCGPLLPVTNLVIGEVISCIPHPDSDHLHICKVNIGQDILNIVCGAPNVREGLKVIVALDGAKLPGGVIKKGMIRGQESNGMLCSMAELGLEHKYLTEQDINGIHELPNDAPIGEDPIKYMELDDEVIDFELTSNRGDLLSILGMAYEIGALYDKKVKDIEVDFKENNKDINNEFSLDIKTANCPLFLVKKVENVTIKESPTFIKNRLIASGIRPINNVVDISNYVMLETGQPLHYYDAERLGNKIIVRMAKDHEKLTTLDGIERTLQDTDIVIANDSGAVGLAGVMGGLTTEIENDTKNIIIESAIFNATAIRKTSKKVLRSEASNRFEKGLDPKRTYMAILRSCYLLEKYADATICGGLVEYKNLEIKDKEIDITVDKINKVLGMNIPKEEVIAIFKRLNFAVTEKEDVLTVTVPTRRIDIAIKEDLIEEVGRIYGIDKIVGKKLVLPVKAGNVNKNNRFVRNKLANLGLNEVLTYSLISENDVHKYTNDQFEHVKILDPMTEERNTLRYSLIPSLLNVYEYNKARNNRDIFIYEVGKGFYRKDNNYYEEEKVAVLMSGEYACGLHSVKVDFYIIKGILEELLDYLGYKNRYHLKTSNLPLEIHPGIGASIDLNGTDIGIIGKIHPNVTSDDIYVMEINLNALFKFKVSSMQYKELSKYPESSRDMAFIVKKDVQASSIIDIIKKACGHLLVDVNIFDVYEGENVGPDEKSIAFNLVFQDQNKTLSEEEVMDLFNKAINDVESKLGAILRDK